MKQSTSGASYLAELTGYLANPGRTIKRIIAVVLEGPLPLLPRVDHHSDWPDGLLAVPQEPHDANREREPEPRSPRCDPKGPVRCRSCPRRTSHRTLVAEAALLGPYEKAYHGPSHPWPSPGRANDLVFSDGAQAPSAATRCLSLLPEATRPVRPTILAFSCGRERERSDRRARQLQRRVGQRRSGHGASLASTMEVSCSSGCAPNCGNIHGNPGVSLLPSRRTTRRHAPASQLRDWSLGRHRPRS